jgi:hypothetical protein
VSSRGLVASELGRGVGLAVGTGFLGRPVVRGGRGMIFGGEGLVMGPTMTLGGIIFGAGAGMYGVFRPPESETEGAFLVGAEGVRIPRDSPMNLGLSSQLLAL